MINDICVFLCLKVRVWIVYYDFKFFVTLDSIFRASIKKSPQLDYKVKLLLVKNI